MTRKINVKRILELRSQGMSMNEISQIRHISNHSVCYTCRAAQEKGVSFSNVQYMTEDTLFAERHAYENAFVTIEMECVHKEVR